MYALFVCSPAGAGQRVLIHVWGESSKDVFWCQTLVMLQTRRPVTICLMDSRSLLSTMSRILNFWWCTTGTNWLFACKNFLITLLLVHYVPDLVTMVDETQDILCWDSTQCVNQEEKGDCRTCCTVGCCCYQQTCQVAQPRRWVIAVAKSNNFAFIL